MANEFLNIMGLYHLIAFSDYVPDPETTYKSGYSLVVVIFVCFMLNFTRICMSFYYKYVGSRLRNKKLKNFKKQMKEVNDAMRD